MKTRMKISIAFVAVMVLSFTGYNVYKTQKAIQLSDVAMANVEALADGEGTNAGYCYLEDTWSTKRGYKYFCDSKTDKNTIYPCPSSMESGWYDDNKQDRCTK